MLILCVGLPGSGIQEWATKEILNNGGYIIRENTVNDCYVKARQKLSEYNLVIVTTPVFKKEDQKKFASLAKKLNHEFKVEKRFLKISPEQCILKDLKLGGGVGKDQIWKEYFKNVRPWSKFSRQLDTKWDKDRVIVCSIDDCLFKNDELNHTVSCILDSLSLMNNYVKIVLITTQDYAKVSKLTDDNCIDFDFGIMTKLNGEYEDVIVKEWATQIRPKYATLGFITGNLKLAEKLRKEGVETILIGNPYV